MFVPVGQFQCGDRHIQTEKKRYPQVGERQPRHDEYVPQLRQSDRHAHAFSRRAQRRDPVFGGMVFLRRTFPVRRQQDRIIRGRAQRDNGAYLSRVL